MIVGDLIFYGLVYYLLCGVLFCVKAEKKSFGKKIILFFLLVLPIILLFLLGLIGGSN